MTAAFIEPTDVYSYARSSYWLLLTAPTWPIVKMSDFDAANAINATCYVWDDLTPTGEPQKQEARRRACQENTKQVITGYNFDVPELHAVHDPQGLNTADPNKLRTFFPEDTTGFWVERQGPKKTVAIAAGQILIGTKVRGLKQVWGRTGDGPGERYSYRQGLEMLEDEPRIITVSAT